METVAQARAARNKEATSTSSEDEISAPAKGGHDAAVESFGKRLRTALKELTEGQYIDIRTSAERQQIANIVGQLQKSSKTKFETVVLRKRTDDPEGKIAIRIKHVGPYEPKERKPSN